MLTNAADEIAAAADELMMISRTSYFHRRGGHHGCATLNRGCNKKKLRHLFIILQFSMREISQISRYYEKINASSCGTIIQLGDNARSAVLFILI
jgi:hypothetical protein